MMNDPIPISREPQMSAEEVKELQKQKFAQRFAAGVLVVVGLVVLAFVVPLGVFLTRLALGG